MCQRHSLQERTALKNDAVIIGYPYMCKKMNLDPYLTTYKKLTQCDYRLKDGS